MVMEMILVKTRQNSVIFLLTSEKRTRQAERTSKYWRIVVNQFTKIWEKLHEHGLYNLSKNINIRRDVMMSLLIYYPCLWIRSYC